MNGMMLFRTFKWGHGMCVGWWDCVPVTYACQYYIHKAVTPPPPPPPERSFLLVLYYKIRGEYQTGMDQVWVMSACARDLTVMGMGGLCPGKIPNKKQKIQKKQTNGTNGTKGIYNMPPLPSSSFSPSLSRSVVCGVRLTNWRHSSVLLAFSNLRWLVGWTSTA